MKKTLFLSFMIVINLLKGQTAFHLELKDNQGKRLPNMSVRFVESSSFERIEKKTNHLGVLDMTFDHGKQWIGSVGEMNNCIWVEMHGKGVSQMQMTYDLKDWERQNRLLPNRANIQFKQTKQKHAAMPKPTENQSALKIVLQNENQKPQANIPVVLTCFALSEQFIGKTNSAGECVFLVPNNNDYEIDVDDINSLQWFDFDEHSISQTLFLSFEKKSFTEKHEGKYVIQNIPDAIKPSSSHAMVGLVVNKGGVPLANEFVYIKTSQANIKYRGKTDKEGKVVFMLPLKTKYIVDFTFQKDAAVVDLSRMRGYAQVHQTVNYLPDPRLENIESFIPRVKDLIDLDVNSFVTSQYPASDEPVELFLKWGNKFNANSKEAILEVGFRVNAKPKKNVIPKNLIFVIDVSGSMANDNRLELLKTNLTEVINKMTPQDRIGIVAFDDAVYKVLPSQYVNDKSYLQDVIRALQPKGGTNISKGFEEGLKQLEAVKNPDMVNRVILLSDGYGGDEPQLSIDLAKAYTAKGVQISAIGVGYDFNNALLEQLATIGGGTMQMAGDPSHFNKAFLAVFDGKIDPIGKDVQLEVVFNDQIVYRQLFSYAGEKVSSGKVTVFFDHLFPGLQKMALMKLDVINSTQAIENQKVIARLTYTDPATKKIKVVEKTLSPNWTPATGFLDMTLDMTHKKMMAVAISNQCLKLMAERFARGDRNGAENAAVDGVRQFSQLFPEAMPEDLNGLLLKLQEYVSVFEQLRQEP